jgi:putative transposase
MSQNENILPIITQSDFDFIRLKLLEGSNTVHWIQLDKNIQDRISMCLEQVAIETLAQNISTEISILDEFVKQKAEIDLLHKALAEDRNRFLNCHYVNYSTETRSKVCRYFDFISVFRLGKILNIPNSTLQEWRKKSVELISGKSIANTTVGEISKSDLTQKLKILFKRHEGKASRRYSVSEKEIILQLVDAYGSQSVHEEMKVSYDTIARLKRERDRGTPKIATAVKYAPVIDIMKKYPGMGPMQIRDYLHRHLGISMGVNSVRKVMEDNGWISSYSRRVKVGDEVRSYESIRRNHLWHIDFKHFFINKCKIYLLFIEDDHSRYITGHAFAEGERLETILEALQEAMNRHGLPSMIMSDGGSAFHSWRGQSQFIQFLEDFGIDHYLSKLPRINGKVESINQKIEKELLNIKTFSSIKHLEEELIQWIWFYNFKRPHQGLGGLQVPADRYFPGWNAAKEEKDSSKIFLDAVTQIVQQLKAS